MKINHLAIYMLLVGWAGVLFALGMPFLLSAVPTLEYQSAFYHELWIVGGLASTVAGGYIAWDQRNNYGQVAAIFLIIGIGSLGYALISEFV